jgi:hypothetical protein
MRQNADLDLSARRNRALTEGFERSLARVIDDEGLGGELDRVSATNNLPMLVMVGTERLADRVRRMDGVRRVARDSELPVQGGWRQPA